MPRVSELLTQLLETLDRDKISVGDFVAQMGPSSFVLIILILVLPHTIPLPELGLSTFTALPVLFLSYQIIIGRQTIWLPEKIAKKNFSQKQMKRMLGRFLKIIMWLEHFMHARWPLLYRPMGQRFIGVLIFIMALVLALPIPGGNFLPGVSISFLALALLEGDGAFTVLSVVFSLASFYVMYQVVALAMAEILQFLG